MKEPTQSGRIVVEALGGPIGLAVSVSARARLPLVAGRTYVFGPVVASNGAPANVGASCHGLVIISAEL